METEDAKFPEFIAPRYRASTAVKIVKGLAMLRFIMTARTFFADPWTITRQ
jgi:hypothetical protein